MNSPYLTLSARIFKELEELGRVVERCLDIWRQFEATSDDRYLDGVALNLHSFYAGLERVLELIVGEVDQVRPSGPNWHQELLRQAATPVPRLRPPVLTDSTRDALDRYRGFRHVVRNIYAFQLDAEQIAPLVRNLPAVFERITAELTRFANALAQPIQTDSG
ncbi:MAG: hypothetical protein NZM11_11200 [Anaerolineales bacterium]|nr:hypothetical protein [Anaerolineales bacterium]MDW8327697.1 hypothetical protein [Anaerolineales bacterium]